MYREYLLNIPSAELGAHPKTYCRPAGTCPIYLHLRSTLQRHLHCNRLDSIADKQKGVTDLSAVSCLIVFPGNLSSESGIHFGLRFVTLFSVTRALVAIPCDLHSGDPGVMDSDMKNMMPKPGHPGPSVPPTLLRENNCESRKRIRSLSRADVTSMDLPLSLIVLHVVPRES